RASASPDAPARPLPEDAAPPLRPCIPGSALARPFSSAPPTHVGGRAAATRSSRACPLASRGAPASSATTGRSSPASARVLSTVATASIRPAHPAFSPARPGNVLDRAPADGGRSCARDAPHSSARATLPRTPAAAALAFGFRLAAEPSSGSSVLSRNPGIDHRETGLRQLEAFARERQQMLAL